MASPRRRSVIANRLRHHVLEWGTGPTTLLLAHGFLEHAHVWDWIAPRWAAAGYRVCAFDWRGHGRTQWVGAGGYYHFADYVADLAGLVRALGGPVVLIAHSMGGNAAILYAGTEPERVAALVSIEGVGPPDVDPAEAPRRFATWVHELDRIAGRPPPARGLALAAATARLRLTYSRLSDEALRHLARHGTRRRGDGRVWRFDPLHRTQSPQPYSVRQARAFWQRVACPVLYVEGDESPLRLPEDDLAERLRALRAARATIAASGHHPHVEQPEATAAAVLRFLRGTSI